MSMARVFGTQRQKRRALLWAAVLGTTALAGLPRAEAQSRFDIIYSPESNSGTPTGSMITVINGAGTHMAGHWAKASSGLWRASIWDANGQVTDLGTNAFTSSYATGISEDGSVVVGYNQGNFTPGAFRWTAAGGVDYIGALGGGSSWAYGVSGDGNIVVGLAQRADLEIASYVWINGATGGVASNPEMYELQQLAVAPMDFQVRGISTDGRYVLGNELDAFWQGVRFDISDIENGNTSGMALGTLSGMNSGLAFASAISADGGVIVGYSDVGGHDHAFRWVEGATGGVAGNAQMYDLGTLGGNYSFAQGVSGNGLVVVGTSADAAAEEQAFRWSEATGMVAVADWLRSAGIDVGANILRLASATSHDGSVVVGQLADAQGELSAYIARVPNAPGGGGGGLMDVEEYQRSLFSTTSTAGAGQFLSWLPMNGAHHRPMMMQDDLGANGCVWATGDFAYHGQSETTLGLAEVGGCVDLFDGDVRLGAGVGTSHSWQELALGGHADLGGQYVYGEVDWQPDGTPLLLSVTGMLGGWDADIKRGYSNGAATDFSNGETDAWAGVIRTRVDWLNAAVFGGTSVNPFVSFGLGKTHVDGFTESGGAFPARFDAQSNVSAEIRLGVAAVTEFNAQTSLTTSLEAVHRWGDAPAASGEVIGLFGFDLGGGKQSDTWLRVGAELDHQITSNATVSASVHAATQGRDASISGSLGFRARF